MRLVTLLSFLTWGASNLPFGAAAPLPSTSSLSLKERNSKPLHLDRELSRVTSSPTPSTTVHSPSFKRGLLFPPSVVNSIATSPITPVGAKKRQESPPTDLSPNTVKRSEDTPPLTERLQQGSTIEERSPNTPDEEPRAWSGLDSRSSDVDNADAIVTVRANTPSTPTTPDSAKDPDYNKKNGYWAPWLPEHYILVTVAGVLALALVIVIVICIMGGQGTLDYLGTWPLGVQNCCGDKAAKRKAKAAEKAAKRAALTPA